MSLRRSLLTALAMIVGLPLFSLFLVGLMYVTDPLLDALGLP